MTAHAHSSNKRQSRKNLLRYIHTQSYSRISGFKGVKAQEGVVRKRILAAITAITLMSVGLIFVFI
jgi:hypothetical protein